MQLIRYTYGPDVREHGEQPILVEDVTARHLTAMRRAVVVNAASLAELRKPALIEVAAQVGADVAKRDKKSDVVTAIVEATEQ